MRIKPIIISLANNAPDNVPESPSEHFFYINFCCNIYSQWSLVSQLNLNELGEHPTISAPNPNTVVVSGGTTNNPRVFRSTNAGVNFSNVTGNITGAELYCVWALDADTIFTGDGGAPGGLGGNAKVYKTTNGGINWSVVLTTGGNSGFMSGIVFQRPEQSFGIIVSDSPLANTPYWVAKTFDGGYTWTVTTPPYTPQFSTQNSPFIVDSAFYGFGVLTTPAKIYITSNAGISWSLIPIGLGGNSVPSISFKSDKLTGIAISDIALPNISRTTNAGINWQTVNLGSGTSGVGTVKWVSGTDIFFFAANKIKRSSNGGISWVDMDTQGIFKLRPHGFNFNFKQFNLRLRSCLRRKSFKI